MKNLQIGIEVELAVFKQAKPVVCDFLPYTKELPLEVARNLYHKDASFLEMAMRPCSSGEELDDVYQEALAQARTLLPDGVGVAAVPCIEYSDEELSKDPYASVMGCSPSDNIYPDTVTIPDQYPDNRRYAGTHVNISTGNPIDPYQVLALDAVLGLKSVRDYEQPYRDDIVSRRKVYGRAGEHRVPVFGIEYRTLPSSTFAKMGGVELFRLVSLALSIPYESLTEWYQDIGKAINTCDAKLAAKLIRRVEASHDVRYS